MPEGDDQYKWSERHSQLNDVLAALVPFRDNIPYYISQAGLNAAAISYNGTAYDIWYSTILEALHEKKVDDLILVALKKFPNDPFLKTALEKDVIVYSFGPKVDEQVDWMGVRDQTFEVLTVEDLNTLLPISFLEQGLVKAKSVAKVQYVIGSFTKVGSGFLTSENVFITNHHVIPDKEIAEKARILFNHEEKMDGLPKKATPFYLDPEKFDTSSEYDYTAVKIKGDANKKFGALELMPTQIEMDDFVNIIQHPGGQYKKIALYHNIVTYSDENRIQYLTDTLKGSSGSPVFNSHWQVVALHHTGGISKENEPAKKISKFRNQGININRVIEGIKKAKLEGRL